MSARPQYLVAFSFLAGLGTAAADAQSVPFETKFEVFRHDEEDVSAFVVRLEQPFLAGEFEQSNYLRLRSLDERSFLVYPRETRFHQKHAEFHGRLRGEGKARLKLSYEIVSENLDGSRKVDVRSVDVTIPVPTKPTGPESIHTEWARQQNEHFANLLRYYPEDSFLEYVLLQSRQRYGVTPPAIPSAGPVSGEEPRLYDLLGGGLAVQESLQRRVLRSGPQVGDLNVHISTVEPPSIRSLDYETLLEKQIEAGRRPAVADVTRLVPADQYVLQLNSIGAVTGLIELTEHWGGNLLGMFSVRSRDHHLREKYERQLVLPLDEVGMLFEEGAVTAAAITGSDFYLAEGTDLTVVLQLAKPTRFDELAAEWLKRTREQRPDTEVRTFNYRGHSIEARYTTDRMVSSFVVRTGDHVAISNSHVAIRRVVDTLTGKSPSLHDAADYRYVTTLLPPTDAANGTYLYGSEAFLKRLVGPEFKIAEKRRRQSFNNLVMLNNASMFFRLEHGRSPESLTELVEGRFVDPRKIVCPGGGAYAWDVGRDTATSSLYNRIKYLTPILELTDDEALKVSADERRQYDRFREEYERFWREYFDPIAIRATVGETTTLETCVLPLANGSTLRILRGLVDEAPRPLPTTDIAETSVASLKWVPGRRSVGRFLRAVPGVPEVLDSDPTLTDLAWLGDRVSLHVQDDDAILELDPTKLQPVQGFVPLSVPQQLGIVGAVTAANRPIYATVEVEDEAKASRLLERLSSRIFLKGNRVATFEAGLDAYRLPDYAGRPVYVLSYQLYAAKLRLHVAVVKGRLIAATTQETFRAAIDAAGRPPEADPTEAHALLRLNLRAIRKSRGDFQLYWAEKARQACHRNIMPIENLVRLYDLPIDEVNAVADAKYGVTFFCPDGEYRHDSASDEVYSTVYGNRQHARQNLGLDPKSSFAQFVDGIDEIDVALRFEDEALLGTITIDRRPAPAAE